MNVQIKFALSPVPAVIALAVALLCPGIAQAVSIGEIISQSKLGDPLSIRVELNSAANENIDSSCLSLVAPDPNEEGAQDYLVSAKLAINKEMGRQVGIISSHKPFNDPFGKIRLRVNCPGQGSVTKTLTFLPDLEVEPLTLIASPSIDTETSDPNKSLQSENQALAGIAPTLSLSSAQNSAQEHSAAYRPTKPGFAAEKGLSTRSGKRQRSTSPRTAQKKRGRPEVFMFKLSSEPIDESRIGKISAEERELLLARQKLLDADDQMASFLAMQHQVKQLQDELSEIKLKLSQLSAGSPVETGAATNVEGSKQPSSKTKEEKIGFFAGGLALAILALLLGLRYYNRIHSQRLGEETWKPAAAEPAPQKISLPLAQPPSPNIDSGNLNKVPPASTPYAKKTNGVFAPSSYAKSQEELSEADAIIEEAELYSTYGHPDRAILMLKELIQQHPNKAEAWELLLLILFSQKKTAEFEQTARDFMRLNKDSASWNKIQAMGRSLERDNPMYAADNTPDSTVAATPQTLPGKRRLIGNILVETGALSAQDMINYLDNFDPKRDGRIGEYLVSCKAITNEQLNDALRLQLDGETAKTPQPADQDSAYFIPDSGPVLDKRLDEYMKMDMARGSKPKKP